MFTAVYWKDLAERVVSSAAGGALTALGADAVNALHLDWPAVLGIAAGTGLVSLLKGLAAAVLPVGQPGSPSLVTTVPRPPAGS